ncbi:MAG: hypothetical protein KIT18_14010 [Burkholderiales bacterium]|nr:hypothetical protein [Burkholderiales bacterium]
MAQTKESIVASQSVSRQTSTTAVLDPARVNQFGECFALYGFASQREVLHDDCIPAIVDAPRARHLHSGIWFSQLLKHARQSRARKILPPARQR